MPQPHLRMNSMGHTYRHRSRSCLLTQTRYWKLWNNQTDRKQRQKTITHKIVRRKSSSRKNSTFGGMLNFALVIRRTSITSHGIPHNRQNKTVIDNNFVFCSPPAGRQFAPDWSTASKPRSDWTVAQPAHTRAWSCQVGLTAQNATSGHCADVLQSCGSIGKHMHSVTDGVHTFRMTSSLVRHISPLAQISGCMHLSKKIRVPGPGVNAAVVRRREISTAVR